MKQIYLIVAVSLVLIAVATVLEGRFTERWGRRDVTALQAKFSERLANVPTAFGDWTSQDLESDPEQLKAAGVVGSLSRAYTNRNTGDTVSMFLVCGDPRHVSVHTPDQCYVGAGFEMEEEEHKQPIETSDGTANFWTSHFVKKDPSGNQNLRIFWAWNHEGEWIAPTIPRVVLARVPALYKIYVIVPQADNDNTTSEEAAYRFMPEFLPVLQKAMFPPGSLEENKRLLEGGDQSATQAEVEPKAEPESKPEAESQDET